MDRGNTRDEAYNMFYSGGLRITTTIDPNIQSSLEDTYEDNSNFPANRKGANGMPQPQSAMVILDYRTGHIKALVGGRHITGRKGTNRATTPRQPGSTIKPLSVYTPVIDTLKQLSLLLIVMQRVDINLKIIMNGTQILLLKVEEA